MAHFLTVADVLARYQLRDRRSARRVMDEAGAFTVGGRDGDPIDGWRDDLPDHFDSDGGAA